MSWSKVAITTKQVANNICEQIEEDFKDVLRALNAPKGMALFVRGLPGNKEFMYEYFFSPATLDYAKKLIEAYSGRPCKKPSAICRDHLQGWLI